MTKYVDIADLKPVPKPRQTRSDKWKQRPCVMAYRTFADELRLQFGDVPADAQHLTVHFRLKMPDSWSAKKRTSMRGQPHRQKPDLDNLVKSICDALLIEDKGICYIEAMKLWDMKDSISIGVK